MDSPRGLYTAAVYEAFKDEPEKFDEFLKLSKEATDNRNDEALAFNRMVDLMKGHPNLREGLVVFFPKLSVATTFVKNVKKRFEKVDTHVFGSLMSILKMYENGKMSSKKTRKKILNLVYYHEDLTEEFLSFFKLFC